MKYEFSFCLQMDLCRRGVHDREEMLPSEAGCSHEGEGHGGVAEYVANVSFYFCFIFISKF